MLLHYIFYAKDIFFARKLRKNLFILCVNTASNELKDVLS